MRRARQNVKDLPGVGAPNRPPAGAGAITMIRRVRLCRCNSEIVSIENSYQAHQINHLLQAQELQKLEQARAGQKQGLSIVAREIHKKRNISDVDEVS